MHDPVIGPPGPQLIKNCGDDIEAATEAELMKSLRLSGVSNDDPKENHVLLNLHEIGLVSPETGALMRDGKVIPVVKNSAGDFKDSSIVLNSEYMERLCNYGRSRMKQTADSILAGSFEKSPLIENPQYSACTYCSYKDLCRFNSCSGKKRYLDKLQGSAREKLESIADDEL